MKTVFEFTNFREFCKHRIDEFRKSGKFKTYRDISKKMGTGNPSFAFAVIKYEKRISEKTAKRLAQVLELSPKEELYFLHLVKFNQEKDFERKKDLAKLIARNKALKNYSNRFSDSYEYFASPTNIILFELISAQASGMDIEKIKSRLIVSVPQEEIKTSLDLLERLEMVEKTGDIYKASYKSIRTDDEISHAFLFSHYKYFFDQALKVVANDEMNLSELFMITCGMNSSSSEKLRQLSHRFRDELAEILDHEGRHQDVFQVIFGFYPLTKKG